MSGCGRKIGDATVFYMTGAFRFLWVDPATIEKYEITDHDLPPIPIPI